MLSPDQLYQIERAAQPLPVSRRAEFVESVIASLRSNSEAVGPGSIHRTVREIQSSFLNASDFDHARGRKIGKYARG